MPRRRPRIGSGFISAMPRFDPGRVARRLTPGLFEDRWPEIERAYGCDLGPELRNEIVVLTKHYLLCAEQQCNALSLGEADAERTALEGVVRQLIARLNCLSPTLRRSLETSLAVRTDDDGVMWASAAAGMQEIAGISVAMSRLLLGLQRAGERLGSSAREYRDWDSWVAGLTRLVHTHGHSWFASRDRRRSPFVRLVAALQDFFPEDKFRRHDGPTVSPAALGKAVSDAQRWAAREDKDFPHHAQPE